MEDDAWEWKYLLEMFEQVSVDEALGPLVQRGVDGDEVALSDELLEVVHSADANLFLEVIRKAVVVVVQQLLGVERHETFQDTVPNPIRPDVSVLFFPKQLG